MRGQHTWHFDHAVYFFLGGLGAGAYVLGVIADFIGGSWAAIAPIGIWVGFPFAFIGAVILALFLGKPMNAIHSWKRPGTSWISRGVLIISFFMLFAVIHIAFWLWPWHALVDNAAARHILGVIGSIFAIGVMFYTGMLLAANRPVAFWSNPLLPFAFLMNSLFSGLLFLLFLSSALTTIAPEIVKGLSILVIVMAVLHLFIIGFYLQGSHRVPEARGSVHLILSGNLATLFWLGVIIIGILVPIVLEVIALTALQGGGAGIHVIAAICGLIGCICLRWMVLAGGVFSQLQAGRFGFVLPHI